MIKTRKQLRECLALDSMNYAKRNKSWTKSFINDLVTLYKDNYYSQVYKFFYNQKIFY